MKMTYSNANDIIEHQRNNIFKIANILKEIVPQEKDCINSVIEILSQFNSEKELAAVSYRTKYREGIDYIITKTQQQR